MKMGDFTILTTKEPIFDEIDFGQKITKCTIKEKACAKNQGFRAKKRSENDFTKAYCFFYTLYINKFILTLNTGVSSFLLWALL